MVSLARKNLLSDKVRLAISVSGVAFAVLLILVVMSLYQGFSERAGAFIEDFPADVWVMQPGASDLFHSSSFLPQDLGRDLAEVEGVDGVTGLLVRAMTFDLQGDRAQTMLMAIDPQASRGELPPSWASHALPAPGQMVIDSLFARKTGLGQGDQLTIAGRPFTVAAVGNVGNMIINQISFVNSQDAQALVGVPGVVNYYAVRVSQRDLAPAVAAQIARQFPDTQTFTTAEFASINRSEVTESFLPIILVLLVIGFVVGVAILGLMAYTSTVERAREYGILKAIGASGPFLYRVVLRQSLIVGALGFVAGVLATLGVTELASSLVPEFVTKIRWQDVLIVVGAAMAMSVVSSYLPVRRIANIDPATVFRA